MLVYSWLPGHWERRAARWSPPAVCDAAEWSQWPPQPFFLQAPPEPRWLQILSFSAPRTDSCSHLCGMHKDTDIWNNLRATQLKRPTEPTKKLVDLRRKPERNRMMIVHLNLLEFTKVLFKVFTLNVPLSKCLQVHPQHSLTFSYLLLCQLIFHLQELKNTQQVRSENHP